MKKVYKVEVDCAACAAKVEDAIKKVDGVNDVTINFMTQKMIIDLDDTRVDEIMKEAKRVGKKVESDFEVL